MDLWLYMNPWLFYLLLFSFLYCCWPLFISRFPFVRFDAGFGIGDVVSV